MAGAILIFAASRASNVSTGACEINTHLLERSYHSCVYSRNAIVVADKAAEDRAGSGAQQPDHDVRHDESARSGHGEAGRHGAAAGTRLEIKSKTIKKKTSCVYVH